MGMTPSGTATQMTDQQATDEAVLLLTRKLMRLHPDAYADTLTRMPDGARRAIHAAELRADNLRNQAGGPTHLTYPADDYDDNE